MPDKWCMGEPILCRRIPRRRFACAPPRNITVFDPLLFDCGAQFLIGMAPDFIGKRLEVPSSGGEFEDSRNDEQEVAREVNRARRSSDLLERRLRDARL